MQFWNNILTGMSLFTLTDISEMRILPSWIKFSFVEFSGVPHFQTVVSFNTQTVISHHVSITPSYRSSIAFIS